MVAQQENDQGNNSDLVATMIDYFKSLQNSPEIVESSDKVEAIGIIVDHLLHDPEGRIPVERNAVIFERGNSKVRKEMLFLLANRIPETSRLQRIGDGVLKKWLTSKNEHRVFMLLSKDAMVQKAAIETSVRLPPLSVDKMVAKLAELVLGCQQQATAATPGVVPGPHGVLPPAAPLDVVPAAGPPGGIPPAAPPQQQVSHEAQVMTISKEITEALLEKSFMKPLKGQKRDYCQRGHKLELPIGMDWMNDVNKKGLFSGFKVISLHKVGLVEKKNCPWAKDSIDFLAFVYDEDKEDLEVWGVEVKSRQTSSTIGKEREFSRQLRRNKYQIIGSDLAHKYVHKIEDRFQVLHHAFVYGLKRVILLVANNHGKILTGTVIDFQNQIHEAYGKVVGRLKEMSLEWAYENYNDAESTKNIVLPNDVISMSYKIKMINGKEAIYGAVKLWREMYSNPTILPRPSLLRIIPSTHAQWNATKGGSDTVTKIADDCFAKPPRNLTNFESVAFCRCISNLLVAVLKLYHSLSAKDDVASKHPSLQHYRNAASHRLTYKKLLRVMYKKFKDEVQKDNNKENHLDETSNTHRVRRARAQGFGIIPDEASFLARRTFETPKKARRKQIEKGTASEAILQQCNKCTGFPVEIVQQKEGSGKDPRRECHICRTKTAWQCSQCRLYFCMSYKKNKRRDEKLYYVREKEGAIDSREITKIYGKSCFHVAHEAAFIQM